MKDECNRAEWSYTRWCKQVNTAIDLLVEAKKAINVADGADASVINLLGAIGSARCALITDAHIKWRANVDEMEQVDKFVEKLNKTSGRVVECGYLNDDSIYVNLTKSVEGQTFRSEDDDWLFEQAEHITELLNTDKDDGKEWVLYGEQNYWSAEDEDGETFETEDIDEADTIQYMICEEVKQ